MRTERRLRGQRLQKTTERTPRFTEQSSASASASSVYPLFVGIAVTFIGSAKEAQASEAWPATCAWYNKLAFCVVLGTKRGVPVPTIRAQPFVFPYRIQTGVP